ncbi:hypothetical protein OEA41_009856 [Lepraria neglecta]|uniref:Uncharacterized protein n=1 Tax=Lepraria neglecta TaxID=209136 RepID=A0AAD9YWQ0_9LECA|nr:hypothetical protein OEA41_009856 [Lepraria neglecta]
MIAKLNTLIKQFLGTSVLIDSPRALGAIIVTIPSTWYLMQPQIERLDRPKGSGHGHGHEGEGHDEHGEESEGGDEGEEQESEEDKGEDESKEGGEGGKSDDSDRSENGAKEVDSGKNVEGVQFKGATSGGTKDNNEQGDTRKHIPDAKGGNKKRIESDYAKRQGEAQKPEEDPSDKDLAASSKDVDDKSRTSQSGKQEGLSNTDTKHSTDIANDPEKSTKAEGGPETAKNKGTVDPSRPQV